MKQEEFILLGTFHKVHGYQGQIHVKIAPGNLVFPETLESIFIKIDGILVPFFLESIVQVDERTYLFSIENIPTREKAIEIIGLEVFILKDVLAAIPGIDHPATLLQFTVLNEKNEMIGIVAGFQDIPGNPILIIKKDQLEMMMPFHPDLILMIDQRQKHIKIRIPQGLNDLR